MRCLFLQKERRNTHVFFHFLFPIFRKEFSALVILLSLIKNSFLFPPPLFLRGIFKFSNFMAQAAERLKCNKSLDTLNYINTIRIYKERVTPGRLQPGLLCVVPNIAKMWWARLRCYSFTESERERERKLFFYREYVSRAFIIEVD